MRVSRGLNVPNIASHLLYIGMTDADVMALRGVRSLIERHADDFVLHFYRHLQAFEGTRAFIADRAVLQRLLDAQRHYVLDMFDANFDDDYYRFRCLIGQTHFRIGLDFKWYVGAYVLYLEFFMPLIECALYDQPETLRQVQSAFRKVTLMDMSIVLEAYHKRDKQALAESNQQMLHQEKLASVGLLVSGLAHEIGNPLASIQAICDNLLNKHLDPPVEEKLKRIRGQLDRIVKIVSQLVNYARPGPPAWRKTELKPMLESALEIARLARNAKSVAVSIEVDSALPPIDGINDELAQVFVNLFVNAYDAMQDQGGKLTVSAMRDGAFAVLRVQDTGCGIPASNRKKIFEPFFTTKDVGKGTGLGLHVSLSIVQNHAGSIEVASDPGHGTCFTIKLPIVQKQTRQNEVPA